MEIYYSEGSARPESRYLEFYSLGRPVYSVNAFVEQAQDGFKWIKAQLPVGRWDKGAIVDALIRVKYSSDEMEAIHNNYLEALAKADTLGKAIEEFAEMQEWRKQCKQEAERIMGEVRS